MPVFPAIFEHVAGNLLSVDGSATQLPAILLAILLDVDAPLYMLEEHNLTTGISRQGRSISYNARQGDELQHHSNETSPAFRQL